MILSLPVVLVGVGVVGAYLRAGWIRIAATITMLVATAWSIALLTDVRLGVAWLIGPLLATGLVARGESPGRLSFEDLTRRALTLAATTLVAIFAAARFPIGENPTSLSGVPWLLAAVGAAWLISPLDRRERTQALVLLVSAGAALLIAAAPGGALTAAASGLMAIAPVIGWGRGRTLPPRTRNGVLTASQTGMAVAYGLQGVQERGQPFISPGTQIYEGMIIGLNRRGGDIDVNATKQKQKTNMRASTEDATVKLVPPRQMSLEESLDFIEDDELVEVTPKNIRMRKRILAEDMRIKLRKREAASA